MMRRIFFFFISSFPGVIFLHKLLGVENGCDVLSDRFGTEASKGTNCRSLGVWLLVLVEFVVVLFSIFCELISAQLSTVAYYRVKLLWCLFLRQNKA